MSKRISLIVLAVVLVLAMVIPSSTVFAAGSYKVKTAEATYASGKLTVTGEVDAGMLAVAVSVYDKDGNFVKLETGAVDSTNKYKVEFTLAEAPYTIKVADFDGGETISTDIGFKYIEEINLTLEAPKVGTEVKMVEVTDENGTYTDQQNKPVFKAEDGAKYTLWESGWVLGTSTSTDLPEGKNWYDTFEGTIESDKYYYAIMAVSADSGYKFKDGLTIKVNGEKPAELFGIYNNTNTDFIVKIKSVDETTTTTDDGKEDEIETATTPSTGDNITIFFVIFGIAAVATISVIVLNKKGTKTKKVSKH